MKRIGIIFLAALLGGFVSIGINNIFWADNHEQGSEISDNFHSANQAPTRLAGYTSDVPVTNPDFTVIAEKTVNMVVHIKTQYKRRTNLYDEFFGDHPFREFFFGPSRPQQRERIVEGFGSGVIIKENGYIITNNHVVQDAHNIEVTLNDNRVFDAEVVGKDPTTDLAIIRIDADNLPYAEFGDSDEVRVGEWVLAVGNPFNLTSTVTAGIVSAKGRHVNILGGGTAIESFIQIDAAVNRGNSGGALVNSNGKLIGVNAAIASGSGSFEGYAFAIPSNIAEKVMEDILEHGEIQRGFLGIEISELDSRRAEELGLDKFRGAYVENVQRGGSADEAGIKKGDLITAVDDREIRNPSELIERIGRKRPGDEVKLEYYRNGRKREATAVLQNIHGEIAFIEPGERSVDDMLGATLEAVAEEEKKKLGINNGVKVSSLGRGKLRDAGVREGFIITHVDREPVASTSELSEKLRKREGEGVLIEGVYPNGLRAYYGIGL